MSELASSEPSAAELESQLAAMVEDSGSDESYGESDPESAAISETVQEPMPQVSLWDQVLPDDPNIPQPYRNRMTVRQLLENERNSVRHIQQVGEERNRLKAQNEVYHAWIQKQLNSQLQQQAQPQAAVAPGGEIGDYFRKLGIDPENDLFERPTEVLMKLKQAIEDDVQKKVDESLGKLQQTQQQRELARTESEIKREAESAWEQARNYLQIQPDQWANLSSDFMQYVIMDSQYWLRTPAEQQRRPNPLVDPRAYVAACQVMKQRWQGSEAAQQQAAQPRPANPPHSTRSSASAPVVGKQINRRHEREIEDFAKQFGLKQDDVRQIFLEQLGE